MSVFQKRFYFAGLLKIISNCLGDPVECNLAIAIPPTKLHIESSNPKRPELTILPPTEYTGINPVMVRLVSHKIRYGSVGSGHNGTNNGTSSPPRSSSMEGMSKTLIVHCHGGGFVAQSSNSHLVYLKHWARGLGVPIMSIDYSLAPEAPYPRALHEAFYSYVWALKNASILGSTAERIVFVGDSAGGLILTGVMVLCIELGIRVPDGAMLLYTPQLLEPAISPARLLSLADPLIPYPALAACLGG
jgi:hormone-sensitive lipase